MIPRFFVSSTYYDLKHVRERLEKFIENYGFQPILFESDKVTYQIDKEIDQSAYFEVGLCHIMALIIGGRYGSSSSSPEKTIEEKKLYDENYISITRKEFETAAAKNIPVLIFIDKNVFAEYETYKENQEFFDKQELTKSPLERKFKFAHVDHINVFKFIDLVKSKPIKTFDKVEEIESYIKAQLAGMFYLYLESLKQASNDKKILDTISELNNITLRMNEMLNSVGKQVLKDDEQEYKAVIDSQFNMLLNYFMNKLYSEIQFKYELTDFQLDALDISKVANIFYDYVLNLDIPEVSNNLKEKDWSREYYKVTGDITQTLQTQLDLVSENLELVKINIRQINQEFKTSVEPFIKSTDDKLRVISRLEYYLKLALGELPF